jgi:hypothetical protein
MLEKQQTHLKNTDCLKNLPKMFEKRQLLFEKNTEPTNG